MSTITLPARELPVLTSAEVVVCGGGPAGFAAAVAAARNGARTVLLEKQCCAGGMMTSGLLPSIIYLDDGEHILSGGICLETVNRICAEMRVKPNYRWQNIHPELMKRLTDRMLREAGVEVYFGLEAVSVVRRGDEVSAAVVAAPTGLKAVIGDFFIDATGDGLFSVLAGADFELGDEEGNTMAPTLCSLFENVDYETTVGPEAAELSPVEFKAVPLSRRVGGVGRAEWAAATAAGDAPLEEYHFVGFFRNGAHSGCGNLGHIYGADVLDERELTRCYMEGRVQAARFLDFYRRQVPGFAQASLAATASQLGVRESRRIVGEYRLCFDDYLNRRHFPDDVASFAYPVDIHSAKADRVAQSAVEERIYESRYQPGEHYGIPYRALLPRKTANLLVAGRCLSADRSMQASVRVVPGCMLTGEAAGTAAALAGRGNCSLRELPIDRLQAKLAEQGVFFPAAE